jgi:pimeloyl-ACP methyl ester carboxylesterase
MSGQSTVVDHNGPEPPQLEPEQRHNAVAVRPVYIATDPDPIFAMAHLPSSAGAHSTGVLLCPPFGWEDMCTYRARRAWADALAQAGHPALRIELPSTGDSAGSPRAPQRLAAWTAAVASAADWLREESRCGCIAALGIGLGGMLAWLAVAQGAAIDDLILWGVPTRGRRFVRELRSFAQLEVDTHVELEGLAAKYGELACTRSDDGELVDGAGRVLTKETLDSLSAVDLTELRLRDAPRRRVLLLEHDRAAADRRVRDYFEAAGSDVTVASVDGYGAMMQYARYSRTPTAAIARSISWLAQAPEAGARATCLYRRRSHPPVRGLETLELCQDGVALRETPLTIDLGRDRLFGILTEPIAEPRADVCAMFLNPGSNRRVGPNRTWVETARRWAARGVPSVRIDDPGIGDSDGDELRYLELSAYYQGEVTARTVAVLDELAALGLPNRFVVVGLCAGAYRAFQAALADRRVVGAFTINLPFFFRSWWTRHVLHGWLVRKRPERGPLLVDGTRWLLRRALPVAGAMLRFVWPGADGVERALNQLRSEGTEVLFLFRVGEPLYDQFRLGGRIKRFGRWRNLQFRRIPGTDHTFRPLPLQRFVSDELDSALARLLESRRVSHLG